MQDAPKAAASPATPVRRPADMRIGTWWRVATVIFGLIGLGSGGAAVFITHLEAGPVALLAVGLVLLLVGIGGRLPSRLKVGDNEAAWEAEAAAQDFAERMVEDSSPGSRPDFLDALSDLARAAPQVAGPALSAVAYKAMVLELLERVVDRLNAGANNAYALSRDEKFTAFADSSLAFSSPADALIRAPGVRIAVEVQAADKSMRALAKIRSWLTAEVPENMTRAEAARASGILLITRVPMSPETRGA